MDPSETNIALYVYYLGNRPYAKLMLPPSHGAFQWLRATMDVESIGADFCLRLMAPSELRQFRQLFPGVRESSRHVRFRSLIRRKAVCHPAVKIEKTHHAYFPEMFQPPARPALFSFRSSWLSSLFKFSFNNH